MSEKQTSLEIIALSVEEAIEKGLEDLGLSEDEVEVEVLDSGSRGLFGIGARQARVRLTIKGQPRGESLTASAEPGVPEAVPSEEIELPATKPVLEERVMPKPVSEAEIRTVVDQELMLTVARDTVEELLEKMKVHASVTARMGIAEDEQSRAAVQVDVRGSDLSILIGPRAETLNALQYIASLIVSKELGHSIPMVIDVEGYRARREQQLRQLARRMADQAIKTGRRQFLEPMPANERRIIHIELRPNPDVSTESVGEEPRRKVTIVPKK